MKIRLLLILFLASLIFVFAQKSAPVAGDAAQLMDLLKKDYNSVSPELKNEEISKDMFKVISIFKSYLTNSERKNFTDNTKVKSCNDIFIEIFKNETLKKRWIKSRTNQQLLGVDTDGTDEDNISDICGYISQLQTKFKSYNELKQKTSYEEGSDDRPSPDYGDLDDKKSEYFTSKFFSDTENLKHLSIVIELYNNTCKLLYFLI